MNPDPPGQDQSLEVPPLPVVLVFGGTDPTGGAGLPADIETIAALGGHAAPVVTAVTVQDTTNVLDFAPQPGPAVTRQARTILEDISVSAIKIGMTGNREVVRAIGSVLDDYPDVPVVLDPVLAAGGGADLDRGEAADAIREWLIPRTTLATPNSGEARRLARVSTHLEECASVLTGLGASYVLITGTHEGSGPVINTLYDASGPVDSGRWDRLPGSYHGSGCTLASAIAVMLAKGQDVVTTCRDAQRYTFETLRRGFRIGSGQALPNRLYGLR